MSIGFSLRRHFGCKVFCAMMVVLLLIDWKTRFQIEICWLFTWGSICFAMNIWHFPMSHLHKLYFLGVRINSPKRHGFKRTMPPNRHVLQFWQPVWRFNWRIDQIIKPCPRVRHGPLEAPLRPCSQLIICLNLVPVHLAAEWLVHLFTSLGSQTRNCWNGFY